MGNTAYQKGETGDDPKPVLYFTRRSGGFEAFIVNTGEAATLDWEVEGAAGPEDTVEVPDWSAVDSIASNTALAGDTSAMVDVTAAAAAHKHYRIMLNSNAASTPTTYIVAAEDEKA